MSKHTPGPWCAVEDTIFKDYGDKAYPVASVESWGEDTDHNARLIAAAPDLLEALKELVKSTAPICDGSYGDEMDNAFLRARAAIKKAEENT